MKIKEFRPTNVEITEEEYDFLDAVDGQVREISEENYYLNLSILNLKHDVDLLKLDLQTAQKQIKRLNFSLAGFLSTFLPLAMMFMLFIGTMYGYSYAITKDCSVPKVNVR